MYALNQKNAHNFTPNIIFLQPTNAYPPTKARATFFETTFQSVDKDKRNRYNKRMNGKGINRLKPVAFAFFRLITFAFHQGDTL